MTCDHTDSRVRGATVEVGSGEARNCGTTLDNRSEVDVVLLVCRTRGNACTKIADFENWSLQALSGSKIQLRLNRSTSQCKHSN